MKPLQHHLGCPLGIPASSFSVFSFLLMRSPGREQMMAQAIRPCHPLKKPEWSSSLQTLSWLSPDVCRQLWTKIGGKRYLCLSAIQIKWKCVKGNSCVDDVELTWAHSEVKWSNTESWKSQCSVELEEAFRHALQSGPRRCRDKWTGENSLKFVQH